MKYSLFFLFSVFFLQIGAQTVVNVSPEEFSRLMAEEKNAGIIDLRTSAEIKSKGSIKNARQIDFLSKDAEEQIRKLDRTKTYLIFCAGGGRSADCAELMKSEGFKMVYHLEKGFDDWRRKGFPVEKQDE